MSLGSHPVRAVLFDYGLTLVTYTRPDVALAQARSRIAAILNDAGVDADVQALLSGAHSEIEDALMAAQTDDDYTALMQRALSARGVVLDRDTVDTIAEIEQLAWLGGVRAVEGAVQTLASLHARGTALGICSNAALRPESMRLQLSHLGFAPFLTSASFASEAGVGKPAAAFFEYALAAIGHSAADTVMVGDSVYDDIDGAHAAGMRAIRLRQSHDDAALPERADLVLDRITQICDAVAL